MEDFIINKGLLIWLNEADNVDDVFSCENYPFLVNCSEEELEYVLKLFRAYIYSIIDSSFLSRLEVIERVNLEREYVEKLLRNFVKGCKKASKSDEEISTYILSSKLRYADLVSYIEDPKYENLSYYDDLILYRINQVYDENPYMEINEDLLLKLVKCAIVKKNIGAENYFSFLDSYLNVLSVCKYVYKIYENSNTCYQEQIEERDNALGLLNNLKQYVRLNDIR